MVFKLLIIIQKLDDKATFSTTISKAKYFKKFINGCWSLKIGHGAFVSSKYEHI
jgi:hypothetical protein